MVRFRNVDPDSIPAPKKCKKAASAAPVSDVKGAAPVSEEDALAAALCAPAVPAGTFGQIKLAQANREFLNFEFSTIFLGEIYH